MIERDIYILNDVVKTPIDYVRGTNMIPIVFHFRDYEIPSGSTAEVFVFNRDGTGTQIDADISGNDVEIQPVTDLFSEMGEAVLQIKIAKSDNVLVTFSYPVNVRPNYTEGDAQPGGNHSGFFAELQAAADAANEAAENADDKAQAANQAAQQIQQNAAAGNYSASVSVGTVTIAEPGSDASVKNSGTQKDAVFDFVLPKPELYDGDVTEEKIAKSAVTMDKTDFLSAEEATNYIDEYRDTFNDWNYNTFPFLNTMPQDNVEFWIVTTQNVQYDSGVQCTLYYESYSAAPFTPVEKTQITVGDTTYYIRHWKFSYNYDVCLRWGFGRNVKLDTSQIVYWTDTQVDEEFLKNNGKVYSSSDDFKKIVSDITNEKMESIKEEVIAASNDEISAMAIKMNPVYGKHIWMIGDSNTQYNFSAIQSLFEDKYGCTFTSYATAGYPWGTENGQDTTDNSAVGQLNRICSQAENLESEAFSEDSHIFLFMMGTNATSGGSGSEATAEDVSTCYGAMNYCFRKISRYARVGNAVGVIIPLEINATDKENQILLCRKYAIPYLDLMTEARIYQDNGANYITDGGNHMAGNGILHWKRIIGKWVAYVI